MRLQVQANVGEHMTDLVVSAAIVVMFAVGFWCGYEYRNSL